MQPDGGRRRVGRSKPVGGILSASEPRPPGATPRSAIGPVHSLVLGGKPRRPRLPAGLHDNPKVADRGDPERRRAMPVPRGASSHANGRTRGLPRSVRAVATSGHPFAGDFPDPARTDRAVRRTTPTAGRSPSLMRRFPVRVRESAAAHADAGLAQSVEQRKALSILRRRRPADRPVRMRPTASPSDDPPGGADCRPDSIGTEGSGFESRSRLHEFGVAQRDGASVAMSGHPFAGAVRRIARTATARRFTEGSRIRLAGPHC